MALAAALAPASARAIEMQPSPAQVQAAIDDGRAAAAARVPPDRLYAWFGGAGDLEPRGFLLSKLVGVKVMASHFALRGALPGEADIRQILDEPSLLVSVIIFGSRPDFALDSYMVLIQDGKVVKPLRVRFDGTAERSRVWPQAPAYRAKVVASFAYADFNPRAQTKVAVYPAGGGEVSFDLDLNRID
jgi:hypothetical protein